MARATRCCSRASRPFAHCWSQHAVDSLHHNIAVLDFLALRRVDLSSVNRH